MNNKLDKIHNRFSNIFKIIDETPSTNVRKKAFSTNIFFPTEFPVSLKTYFYFTGFIKSVFTHEKTLTNFNLIGSDWSLIIYYDSQFNNLNIDDKIYQISEMDNEYNSNVKKNKKYYEDDVEILYKLYYKFIKYLKDNIKDYPFIKLYSFECKLLEKKNKLGYLGHPNTFSSFIRFFPLYVNFDRILVINITHTISAKYIMYIRDWINSDKKYLSFEYKDYTFFIKKNTDINKFTQEYQFENYKRDKNWIKIFSEYNFEKIINDTYRPMAGIFGSKGNLIKPELFEDLIMIAINDFNVNQTGFEYSIDEAILNIICANQPNYVENTFAKFNNDYPKWHQVKEFTYQYPEFTLYNKIFLNDILENVNYVRLNNDLKNHRIFLNKNKKNKCEYIEAIWNNNKLNFRLAKINFIQFQNYDAKNYELGINLINTYLKQIKIDTIKKYITILSNNHTLTTLNINFKTINNYDELMLFLKKIVNKLYQSDLIKNDKLKFVLSILNNMTNDNFDFNYCNPSLLNYLIEFTLESVGKSKSVIFKKKKNIITTLIKIIFIINHGIRYAFLTTFRDSKYKNNIISHFQEAYGNIYDLYDNKQLVKLPEYLIKVFRSELRSQLHNISAYNLIRRYILDDGEYYFTNLLDYIAEDNILMLVPAKFKNMISLVLESTTKIPYNTLFYNYITLFDKKNNIDDLLNYLIRYYKKVDYSHLRIITKTEIQRDIKMTSDIENLYEKRVEKYIKKLMNMSLDDIINVVLNANNQNINKTPKKTIKKKTTKKKANKTKKRKKVTK